MGKQTMATDKPVVTNGIWSEGLGNIYLTICTFLHLIWDF